MTTFGSQSTSRHKIIVGIDYGTTFSGVSYVTTDKSSINDINIISSWPGNQHARWKTPTRIAYARENSQIQTNKWGFEVHSKLTSYSWTKLLLDQNTTAGEYDDPTLSALADSGVLRLPSFRQAPGVCEDFLREVYHHVSEKLRQEMTDLTWNNTPMECWVTLPAIWSDEAKDATLSSARKAGFGARLDDEVFTITEPEAAAIATLKSYSLPGAVNAIQVDENILICDYGGGTVDITTYVIKQVSPRLEFDELRIGAGGKCGSTTIDRNLHNLLSERFGSTFNNISPTQKGPGSKFMNCFETYKQSFGLSEEEDEEVMELGPIRLDVEDSEYYDEDERLVKLTYEDMKGLFEPVVAQIKSLLDQQVREAKETKNAHIGRMVLVGGFAESPYLFNALDEWCWQHGSIRLMRPQHPQAAVVRGAALRGLEGVAPRIKHVRRHYGVALGVIFREGVDPEEEAYYDEFDNTKRCRNRMQWLISKGDEVIPGVTRSQSCCHMYTPGKETSSTLVLYSCSLETAPDYRNHARVEKVGIVSTTFPADYDYGGATRSNFNHLLGRTFHEFLYTVQVTFGGKGSNLTFQMVMNGKVVSTATIKYDQR